MGGDRDSGASDVIVYIDRSDIRAGRIEDLRAGVRRLVDVIESLEPQLLSYGFHIDEEAAVMTVVAVHPDPASLELHLDVGRAEFQKLGDMITLRQIDVYGSPGDKVRAMLEQKAAMLGDGGVTVHERFAGFSRAMGPTS